MSHIFPTALYL